MALDISHLAQQIVNLSREYAQGTKIRAHVLGTEEESSVLLTRRTPLSDLGNPEIYSMFFKATLGIAISPHAKRYVHAEAMGIKSRSDARRWSTNQANDYSPASNRAHADLAGNIGGAS